MFTRLNKGVFPLRKKILTLSATALMLGGLVACNTDEGAMGTRNADNARPIGYYSNENNNRGVGDQNGNAYTLDDNDGPLTEMFDRNGNNNGNNNTRYGTLNRDNNNNRNDNNRFGTLNKDNNNNSGIFNRDNNNNGRNNTILNRDRNLMDGNGAKRDNNRFSRGDANYHGHVNDNNDRRNSTGYTNNYDGDLVRRITDRAEQVKNVDDVRAVVMGNNIIVAVDTDDKNDKNVKDEVRNVVQTLAKGKNINVVTDEATFSRVRNLDNDIREGNSRDTINTDMNDLFENIGDTIRRPFTNNNNS